MYRTLHKVSTLLASDRPIKIIAENIGEILCKDLEIDRCLMYGYENKKSNFVVECCGPLTKWMDDIDENSDAITKYINFQHRFRDKFYSVDHCNSVVVCPDVKCDSRFDKISEILEKFRIASHIIIITTFNNKVNGGLYVHQSSIRKWSEDEIELIEMIAEQFSVAINRSSVTEQVVASGQRLLEKALKLKTALLQEKNARQMQNNFIAIVSHEFKTPLQIIDSARELLVRKLRSILIKDNTLDKYLDKIKNGVTRINGLIHSILSLSKLEESDGNVNLTKQDFDLKNLIAEIINRNHGTIIDKAINFIVKIDSMPNVYNGDQKLIDHCFANIITNAIKYSKNNSLVTIDSSLEENNIVVRIADNGIGIPKDDLDNVGKKFFRAKNAISVSGTGVGLFLTKYFVELHNGSVLIESELDVGTTVSIFLPLQTTLSR